MDTMRVEAEAVVFEISTALGILEIVEFPRYASKGVLYAEDDGKQERPGPLVGHGSGDDKKSAGIERVDIGCRRLSARSLSTPVVPGGENGLDLIFE